MQPTSATITFTGLLVFRRDPKTGNFEVGVLRARHAHQQHIFEIQVTPNPNGSDTLRLQQELEDHVSNGNILWQLDVEPDGSSPNGIDVRPDPPQDRQHPTSGNRQDFGWIINLQREFHPDLEREPGGLQPIILFKTGRFDTSCKTDFVDVHQHGRQRDFGFIAGALRLTINTSRGQQPVLSVINQQGDKIPVFRLLNTDQIDYEISIRNTPPLGSGPSPTGGHFHMFYELLFTKVPRDERIAIVKHKPETSPADRCPDFGDPDPDPFRCGGVTVEGGPLGHP